MPKQNMKHLDTTINELDEKRKSIAKQVAALKREAEGIDSAMLKLFNEASDTEKAYIRSKLKRIKQNG